MDLQLAVHPAVLVLSALGAGALAWWSYGRSTPAIAGWRRVVLPALRFAALFLVLLLLVEPAWRTVTRSDEPALLALLVDDSLSLRVGGDRAPAGAVRAALADLDDEAVQLYRFSAEARPSTADSLSFRGARTDIAEALARVESDFAGRNLRGVVLVSDGRVTDGRNPIYPAERFPVPIYTAVAGDSLSSRDVRLARVVTNDVAAAGSVLPVSVAVRATGYAGQRTRVVLSERGTTLATAPLTLPGDGGEATVELSFVPRVPGVHRYTARVEPMAGEATARNNAEAVTVRVVDDRRRVLLLGAGPSPDFAAARAALEADDGLDVTVRTQRSPGAYYEGALPPALATFDLAVLVGWPGQAATEADARRLGAAAQSGLPVVFLLSRQTDLSRLAETLGDVLPARPAVLRAQLVEASLAVAPDAGDHPVLDGLGVAAGRLGALPPLAASTARWALQPGARVLAGVRRGGADLGTPLLAVRQSGALRSAVVLGAGTWRWRTLPDDLADLRPAYGALLSNLARWTSATRDRRPVRVRADRRVFDENERVTFSGQVYGENLAPVADARIGLTVTGPGGRRVQAPMRPIGNGRYVADVGAQPPGTYRFSAVAERDGARLGSDAGTFAVGETAAEYRAPGADPGLMQQVALRSGGRAVPLDSLGAFVRELRADGALDPRVLTREDDRPLLDLTWLLGLALALLTAEWVLRKRAGMV